jgi:hypothetical protein
VSIGVALMATVLAGFTPLAAAPPDPQRALEGYHWSFVVSTALALVAAAVATRIRDEDAAATMDDRGRHRAARAAITSRGRGRTTVPRRA